MNDDQQTALSHAALALAEAGMVVFPCNNKAPCVSGGYKNSSCDPAQIRAWWTRWPKANIGLPMQPNGLVAVDIDAYKADCLWCEFAAGKEIPPTWEQQSARGGRHLIFRADPALNFPGKLTTGVEVKWHGYILAAPSALGAGRRYRCVNPREPAPAPGWLLESAHRAPPPREGPPVGPVCFIEVRAALLFIPNYERDWEHWSKIGAAVFNATGGSDDGFWLWDQWSRKCREVYDPVYTRKRWETFRRSPYSQVGIQTLEHFASRPEDARYRDAVERLLIGAGDESASPGEWAMGVRR